MSRIICSFMISLLFLNITTAQTYYYKLAKKVHNGATTTNVSGGQFITFMADICYESNKKGIGVGHGTLQRNSNFSNSQFKVYMGNSYWGSDATFKFTSDLATLNVATESGDIYLYKRTTPPANATTCSLIRKPLSGSGGSPGGNSYPVQPSYPIGSNNGSTNGGTASGGNYGHGQTQQRKRKWHDCSLCHGKGKIVRDSHVSTYGQEDPMVYCAECGRSWHQSTGHHHVTCPTCHGNKGWWSE